MGSSREGLAAARNGDLLDECEPAETCVRSGLAFLGSVPNRCCSGEYQATYVITVRPIAYVLEVAGKLAIQQILT